MGVFRDTFTRFIVEGLLDSKGKPRVVKHKTPGFTRFDRQARPSTEDGAAVCGQFTDPHTGCVHRVLIETYKSRAYYGKYRDASGRPCKVALGPDKAAAEQELQALKRESHRVRAKLDAPREVKRQKLRPLTEHLRDYLAHLARLGRREQHRENVETHVRKIAAAAAFGTLDAVTLRGTVAFLDRLHFGDVGAREPGAEPAGRSLNTCRAYCGSLKAFLTWAVAEGRLAASPLARFVYNKGEKSGKTRVRRALSCDEFARLVDAAGASRRPVESISGPDRAMLYILACWTGLRRSELGSLTVDSFKLLANAPTVTVLPAYSKRGREDVIALHDALAPMVAAWLSSKGELAHGERVLPMGEGKSKRKTAKMARCDLAAARRAWLREARAPLKAARSLPADSRRRIVARVRREAGRRRASSFLCYVNAEGAFADFHAHRVAFITNLNRAGVAPRIVQQLARHSDIRLTMGVYTALEITDQVSGIQALPAPPRLPGDAREAQVAKLSGTDGRPLETDSGTDHGAVRFSDRSERTEGATSAADFWAGDSGTPEVFAELALASSSDLCEEDKRRVANGTRTRDPQIHNLEVCRENAEKTSILAGPDHGTERPVDLDQMTDEEFAQIRLRIAKEELRRAGRPVDRHGDREEQTAYARDRVNESRRRAEAAG